MDLCEALVPRSRPHIPSADENIKIAFGKLDDGCEAACRIGCRSHSGRQWRRALPHAGLRTDRQTENRAAYAADDREVVSQGSGACRPHSERPAVFAPPGKIGIESAMTKTPATPDLVPVLDELKAGIDRLVSGLELPKPVVPEPAAVETPAAEAA